MADTRLATKDNLHPLSRSTIRPQLTRACLQYFGFFSRFTSSRSARSRGARLPDGCINRRQCHSCRPTRMALRSTSDEHLLIPSTVEWEAGCNDKGLHRPLNHALISDAVNNRPSYTSKITFTEKTISKPTPSFWSVRLASSASTSSEAEDILSEL